MLKTQEPNISLLLLVKSEVNVIDAKTMSADLVAVVELPNRVPYGFHAFFVTEWFETACEDTAIDRLIDEKHLLLTHGWMNAKEEADAKRIADLEYALSVQVGLHRSEQTKCATSDIERNFTNVGAFSTEQDFIHGDPDEKKRGNLIGMFGALDTLYIKTLYLSKIMNTKVFANTFRKQKEDLKVENSKQPYFSLNT
ncbi:hypothetical protein ACJX0J_020476 [Zea mays]